MVTNVPSRCVPYWNKYEEASTTREKISALEELIACIPKHKGTEKLLKDLKMKLAKLRAELSKEISSKPKPRHVFSVSKKGDAQIVLLGTPYSGKTSIVNYLCGSSYIVGSPTQKPQEGVFKWEGCEFQMVDLPPISSPNIDSVPNGRAIMGVAYNSDLIGVVIDAAQDVEWQIKTLLSALHDSNIVLREPPPIKIKKTSRGGITVIGQDFSPFDINELRELLKTYRIVNCIIEFYGRVSEYDLYLALNPRTAYKKAIIIMAKMDLVDDKIGTLKYVKKILLDSGYRLPIIPFSIHCERCRYILGEAIFRELNLIRIWTKKDGIVHRERAVVLRKPATVRDVCEKIHSEFVRRFRYAIIERKHDRIRRRVVGLDYPLEDGDIITIQIRD